MNDFLFSRRRFLKNSSKTAAGLALTASLPKSSIALLGHKPKIKFSVIGINHSHIYGMVDAVIRGGGELASFYAKEPELAAAFSKRYPQAKLGREQKEILEDRSTQLILSSGIPVERAPVGIEAMQHGKDFLVDKPGITTPEQLAIVRRVQKETGRMYTIFIERLESKTILKAGALIKAGAIGKVIQTMGTGPHRINPSSRPEWFFDKKYFGGIITDLGSHQFDQFLYFTGSAKAVIVSSQVGNIHHPQYPAFEDFGDVMLRGDQGTGYFRVDWFTPDGLKSWGDGRMTILGTDGYIELRKTIDIGGREGGNHLFLVNQEETRYINCNNEPLPFSESFVSDVINRTETAIKQEECFLAAELALKAQAKAQELRLGK
ncbi:MAG: Gfo/Idh/MocA family oxidoreductase [Chitinophagaceae bacterium]|nr:Gfo/Idh/MocA family oxidoreductase [Chitinophagaceae bacterium]